MKRFLVASPHSFCDSAIVERHCDTVALDAGDDIVKNLKDHITVYHPNVLHLRSSGDYNRPETDGTVWREKLKQHASELKPDFMLEVHSFPGDHPLYMRLWGDVDLVVFESKYNRPFLHRLVAALKRHNENIVVHVARPWHIVSITDDMGKHVDVKRHTLFEFNENRNKHQRKKIADTITAAVIDIVYTDDIYITKKINVIATIAIIIAIIILIMVSGFIVSVVSSFLFRTHSPAYTCHQEEALRTLY
jgi:hypothetical protein